jgi:catechol 2,3-dioxygenase-like lactoylglutathione lyase family enzyme
MNALNLLVLRCADLERARAFYEHFGLRFTKHGHGAGPEHYAHEDGRGVFELYPAKNSAAPGDQTGLGFGVDDLDATRAALAAGGFAPGEATDHPWGRTFVVRDPDGRRVEVKAK